MVVPPRGSASASMPAARHSERRSGPPLIQQRIELRGSPRIWTTAAQFWSTLGKQYGETMSRDEYAQVHRRIAKVLAPELTDDEAHEAAQEDWVEDLCGHAEMTLARFIEGLLSIADGWVNSSDEVACDTFLERLYHRITERFLPVMPPPSSPRTSRTPLPRTLAPRLPPPRSQAPRTAVRPSVIFRNYSKLGTTEKVIAVGTLGHADRERTESQAPAAAARDSETATSDRGAGTSPGAGSDGVAADAPHMTERPVAAVRAALDAQRTPQDLVWRQRQYRSVASIEPFEGDAEGGCRRSLTSSTHHSAHDGGERLSRLHMQPAAASLDMALEDEHESSVRQRLSTTLVPLNRDSSGKTAGQAGHRRLSLKRRSQQGRLDEPSLPQPATDGTEMENLSHGVHINGRHEASADAAGAGHLVRSRQTATSITDSFELPVIMMAREVSLALPDPTLGAAEASKDDANDGHAPPHRHASVADQHQHTFAAWPSRRSMLQAYLNQGVGSGAGPLKTKSRLSPRRLRRRPLRDALSIQRVDKKDNASNYPGANRRESAFSQRHGVPDVEASRDSSRVSMATPSTTPTSVQLAPCTPHGNRGTTDRAKARLRPPSRLSSLPTPDHAVRSICYFDATGRTHAIAPAAALAALAEGGLPPVRGARRDDGASDGGPPWMSPRPGYRIRKASSLLRPDGCYGHLWRSAPLGF